MEVNVILYKNKTTLFGEVLFKMASRDFGRDKVLDSEFSFYNTEAIFTDNKNWTKEVV